MMMKALKALVLLMLAGIVGVGAYLFFPPALHRAAYNDDPHRVKALLWMGYDIEDRRNRFKDSVPTTPLEWAARSGAEQAAIVLLAAGASPVGGRGALHVAAQRGHVEVIDAMLRAGIYPGLQTDLGTPLHWAALNSFCESGPLEAMRRLLEAGADPNVHRPLTADQLRMDAPGLGATPLYDAVFSRCPQAVRLLLDYGADREARVHGVSVIEFFEQQKMRAGRLGDPKLNEIAVALGQ